MVIAVVTILITQRLCYSFCNRRFRQYNNNGLICDRKSANLNKLQGFISFMNTGYYYAGG
jgi:hypothetical protein